MAKKINSAKINKNIENVGEYSEMIKDEKNGTSDVPKIRDFKIEILSRRKN